MITGILNAIATIPELLKAIRELLAYFRKADEEAWFKDKTKAFQDALAAQTPEERKKAIEEISNALRRL